MRISVLAAIAALISACAAPVAVAPVAPADTLDLIARDFVVQTLAIGERDPGYVDAYYGPPALQAQAKARPRTLPELRAATDALLVRLGAVTAAGPLDARRHAFLHGQLVAAQTRLRMLSGERIPFVDEARGLFGVALSLKPLSFYDPILARIGALVPGEGTIDERVTRYEDRFNIPTDRLKPVMEAAIAECRRRTLQRIALPAGESFDLAFVTGKSWGGYNYYKGNAHSRIEINTDLPIRLSRAVDLGCHEGYPGHHVYNALLEDQLARKRGWIEFTVYPLYSPQSFIAEGSANYGIELAFPGTEQAAFEAATLYLLAGLPAAEAQRYYDLQQAKLGLAGARFTIAADYLDGKITREKAIVLSQQYRLQSRARSEKDLDFIDDYRSYVINYGLGLDMVRDYVEAAGPSQAARWARMTELLSGPTVPADLARR